MTRELRATVEDALSTALDKISGADIKSLLRSCYDIYTDYVLITDVKKNRIILFNKEALEELRTYDDCEYSLRRTNKARTSRQIWRRRPDGTEYDTLMRVRLVLNNGVSALFGMGANKSSCPCIKIQQDKIAKFLDNVTDKAVIEDYSLANLP
jgi:signal transduction histidine kinase